MGLAVGMVTLAAGLGASIYGDYRDKLRQSIFQHAKVIGYLFERKEHLAFGAILLAYAWRRGLCRRDEAGRRHAGAPAQGRALVLPSPRQRWPW